MRKSKFSKIYLFVVVTLFANNIFAAPPETPPKKWPCDQVYNPKLDLTAIWEGPAIDDNIKNWWKDDEIIEYVNIISNPILSEEEGSKKIEELAKKYTYFGLIKKKEQTQKLVNLFAGLYQKASSKRNKQYSGIIKFVERQDSIRKTIGNSSKELRRLRKSGVGPKDPAYIDASSSMEWNTIVFDQRTKLTEFICEEPVYGEQRLGYQSRKINSYLK